MEPKDDALAFELGNALTDRLGLNPRTTLREYDVEEDGNHVTVTLHSQLLMRRDEYEDLVRVAALRAAS